MRIGNHVLITTVHRGVFCGVLSEERDNGETVVLEHCRNCLYWGATVRGFLGLASTGPDESCKIGPAVSQSTLYGVTSISECSVAAVKAWESEPWS